MRLKVSLLFVLLCILWGSTYTANKIGLEWSPPMFFAGARMFVAGIILAAAAIIGRLPRPRRDELKDMFLMSFGNVTFLAVFMTYALTVVGAGEASIFIYTQPLMVAALAVPFLHERLGGLRILGLLLGFAGVVSVLAGKVGVLRPEYWLAYLALLLGAFGWACATIYFRLHPLRTPIVWSVALQLLIGGGLILIVAAPVDHYQARWGWQLGADLAYLGAFGIGGAYWLWFRLIEHGQVSRLAAYLFMAPLFATLIGIAALGERLLPLTVIGMALTISGIYLVNRQASGSRHIPIEPPQVVSKVTA